METEWLDLQKWQQEEDVQEGGGEDVIFGPEDLVFTRDDEAEIHSGGFSVHSILLKNKIPPIITYNVRQEGGSGKQVSDLFRDLVVPNWAYQAGGSHKSSAHTSYSVRHKKHNHDESESEPEEDEHDDDDVLDEKLHQKLLDLVRMKAQELKPRKKSAKKRDGKKTSKTQKKR